MQPLDVLMVSPQYWPVVGGYERAAERLSAALAARGHGVTVVCECYEGACKEELRSGVRIRRLRCVRRRRVHTVTAMAALGWFLLLEGRRYDVWHVHQYGYHAALCSALGALTGRPVVLKLTSTGPMGVDATLRSLRFSKGLAALHRRTDACIATTHEAEREALRFGWFPSRVARIGNAIDVEAFSPASAAERATAKAKLGITAGLLVLSVGRLSAEKNLEGLIEAWRRVAKQVSNATLAIVGDGPLLAELRREATEAPIAGRTQIVGPTDDVRGWLRAADVFVLTSRNEGLSNGMLEALACGLPIVSTRVSGAVEAVERGGAGRLVPVGDIGGFAQELAAMLVDTERRLAHGQSARRYASERYSQQRVVDDVLRLYRNVRPTASGARGSALSDATHAIASAAATVLPAGAKGARFVWRAARNAAAAMPILRDLVFPGSEVAEQFGPDDAAYAWAVFAAHRDALGRCGFVRARRVLEAGPGRNRGTALLWWCDQQDRVDAVREPVEVVMWDVFPNLRDADGQWGACARSLLDGVTQIGPLPLAASALNVLRQVAAGNTVPDIRYLVAPHRSMAAVLAGRPFDLVYSQAALEHAWDIGATWSSLADITAHSGWHSHRIDLADHGRRESNYIEMLEWSTAAYWMSMRFVPGAVNRWRAADHLRMLVACGFRILDERRERRARLPIPRERLARPFRALPLVELTTTALDVVARREYAHSTGVLPCAA